MQKNILILAAVVALGISGCGGSNDSPVIIEPVADDIATTNPSQDDNVPPDSGPSDNTDTPPGSNLEDDVPPDPGESENATLEGIDSDRDGIRDDIQIAISELSLTNEVEITATRQYARGVQGVIVSGTDPSLGEEAHDAFFNSLDCMDSVFGRERARVLNSLLEALYLNTNERSEAYDAYNDLPFELEIDPDADLGGKCD